MINSRRGYAYKSSRTPNSRPPRQQRAPRGNKHGQYIDPVKFVKIANPAKVEDYIPKHKFTDFAVDRHLHDNIVQKGYVIPTPIQDQTIELGLAGKDVVGLANTGTGKTAAFLVPILHQLMTDRGAKALIVAPTRELAQQIETERRSLSKGGGVYGALLIGGASYGPQLKDLRSNPNIVVGTPGRIKDHIEQRSLDLGRYNIVVLDEVDRMLDMGFVNDVKLLLSKCADKRQSFYFSATMDRRVSDIIDSFSPEAITVSVKQGDTSENVHQDVIPYADKFSKIEGLHNLLIEPVVTKSIIFESTQRNVERLETELKGRGFSVMAIHGGKTQGQRKRALDAFKENKVPILIATDVAARGIDVADISHVVNYGMPQTYEDYTHRIGRAGRAGKVGYALTFVEQHI
ncbi:MAG TPA: DEAD/DEAH box helicase [Candidatus Saccharimonadales bacterium]|nr:DEAD/DEAH box helicase [Candidatus Saccharimonadales bacterium]